MSWIQNDHLNYLTTVEQFFLSLKGSGLTLSAQDYFLIRQWEARAVPVERLCRALEDSVAALRRQGVEETGRLSLQRVRDLVEAELLKGKA